MMVDVDRSNSFEGRIVIVTGGSTEIGRAYAKRFADQDAIPVIDEINGQVEEFEKVGFIVVASSRWTIEDGQLTPTMKIRRSAIEDLYTGKLDDWYASGDRVIWE